MKKYRITAHGEDCISHTKIITANNYDEALSLAWEMFPEYDSVYVSEE